MTCAITITDVLGLGSPPSSVQVSGTATDCAAVLVTVQCSGAASSAVAPVAPDGTWTVTVTHIPGCVCGRKVTVNATCESDPSCTTYFAGNLECAGRCPTISTDVQVGECNPDGSRQVSLTATITPATGGGDVVAQWDFGDGSLGAAWSVLEDSGPTSNTDTHPYSPPGPYVATVRIVLPEDCPSVTVAIPTLAPCPTHCPEVVDLTPSVSGCAGGGASATVAFSGTLSPPTPGCSFQWDFGDGSPEAVTVTPEATHAYAEPGTYAVGVAVVCGDCLSMSTVTVEIPPCCPVLTDVSAPPPEDCADPVTGRTSTATFTAATDPPGSAGTYTWTFDDGSPPQTTNVPTIDHTYTTAGDKTVQVTFTPSMPGCEPSGPKTATIHVPSCGQPPSDEGEGWGCKGLRWAGVILLILATIALYIGLCIPGAGSEWLWAAVSLAVAGAVLLVLWAFFCPKPCGWALLLAWQVALGAGIGALYFAKCCPWLWAVGGGLIAAGLAGLIAWWIKCHRTLCQVLVELAIVLSVVILPVLGWIASIPFLTPCLTPAVDATVASVTAAVTAGLAACASRAGLKE